MSHQEHGPLRRLTAALIIGLLIAGAAGTALAHGDHPRRAKRIQQCAVKGDAWVSKRVARHTVGYAVERRYRISDIVDGHAIGVANQDVYEFLKWKLGNPTAICAHYIGHGFTHFERGYADEAAAAALGFELPGGSKAAFTIPESLLTLGMKLESQQADAAAKVVAATFQIPENVAKEIIGWWLKEKYQFLGRVEFNMPKKWDMPNALVTAAIQAKRNPRALAARLQAQIDGTARRPGKRSQPVRPALQRRTGLGPR